MRGVIGGRVYCWCCRVEELRAYGNAVDERDHCGLAIDRYSSVTASTYTRRRSRPGAVHPSGTKSVS
jgi:hypothetical protein